MATKSKFGSGSGNTVSDNQNWTDCIDKERLTSVKWAQDWGFLARGKEEIKGRSAKDIEKMCASMQAKVDELQAKVDKRYAHTGGNWMQASNTIGAADWNEDSIIKNAIWKSNNLSTDKWIQPTDPY
jgi:hypothetical protein